MTSTLRKTNVIKVKTQSNISILMW